jgi:hypothetical protein
LSVVLLTLAGLPWSVKGTLTEDAVALENVEKLSMLHTQRLAMTGQTDPSMWVTT